MKTTEVVYSSVCDTDPASYQSYLKLLQHVSTNSDASITTVFSSHTQRALGSSQCTAVDDMPADNLDTTVESQTTRSVANSGESSDGHGVGDRFRLEGGVDEHRCTTRATFNDDTVVRSDAGDVRRSVGVHTSIEGSGYDSVVSSDQHGEVRTQVQLLGSGDGIVGVEPGKHAKKNKSRYERKKKQLQEYKTYVALQSLEEASKTISQSEVTIDDIGFGSDDGSHRYSSVIEDQGCVVSCLENSHGVAPELYLGTGETHVCRSGKHGSCPAVIRFFQRLKEDRDEERKREKNQCMGTGTTSEPEQFQRIPGSADKKIVGRVVKDAVTGELKRYGNTDGLTEKMFDRIAPPWMIKYDKNGVRIGSSSRFFRASRSDPDSERSVVTMGDHKRLRCKRTGKSYLLNKAGLQALGNQPNVVYDEALGTVSYRGVQLVLNLGTSDQSISPEFAMMLGRFNTMIGISTKLCNEDARDDLNRTSSPDLLHLRYSQVYPLLEVNKGLPFPLVKFSGLEFKYSDQFAQCINYVNDLMPRASRIFSCGFRVAGKVDWSKLTRH